MSLASTMPSAGASLQTNSSDAGIKVSRFWADPKQPRRRRTGIRAFPRCSPGNRISRCHVVLREPIPSRPGRSEMQRLLDQDVRAEAYFCADDVLSIGALSAISDAGLKVPEDIGVIGLNDMEIAGWENISLTTIRQPIQQIINSSVELIVSMLDEPARYPEARLFPCTVIERGTLRAP